MWCVTPTRIRGTSIEFEVEISDTRVYLTVLDQGQGFARAAVPDPDEEQLGGRGIQLIEQIADVAWFECVKGQGTKLVAEFSVVAPPGDVPRPPCETADPAEKPWTA